MSILSYLSQKFNQAVGSSQSQSTLQVTGKSQKQRILESGLEALEEQRQRSSSKQTTWTVQGCNVKAWVKAGFVVTTTTAAYYFGLKALGYFPGSEKSGRQNSHDGAETDGGIVDQSVSRRETDVSRAIQQSQKRINRYVSRYDEINPGLSLPEKNSSAFKELEVSDVEIPKDARHNEDDILEIDTSEIKQTTQHLRLLQAPVVQNPIPDQKVLIGEQFNLPLRNVFHDADGDFLRLSVKLGAGDPWVSFSFSPILLGSYDTPSALSVTVIGTTAYVADGDGGLLIIDVSNPRAPTLLGTYDTPSALSVTVSGSTAFLADGDDGLLIIDVSNPRAPTLLGTYDTPGNYAKSVTVIGTTAYVAAHSSYGLKIIDVSNPRAPTFLGSYPTLNYWAEGVTVIGTTAFVAAGYSGLLIIDVSNPRAPTLLGTYDTPGYASGVTVSGTTAFVADGDNGLGDTGLKIIDVSNPRAPTLLGTYYLIGYYNTPAIALDVTVIGTTAFVADYGSGLKIIDVSNPRAPTLLGTYDTPGAAQGVTVSGTTAFVADGDGGLQIIDIGGDWSLSGTPTSSDQQGVLFIKVTANDGFGGIAEDDFSLTVSTPTPLPTRSPALSPTPLPSASKWNYAGPSIGVGVVLLGLGIGGYYYRKRGHQSTPKENRPHGDPVMPETRVIPPLPHNHEILEESISCSKPVKPSQHRSSVSMEVMPDPKIIPVPLRDIHVDLHPIVSDENDSFFILLSTIRDLENANQTLTDATREMLYHQVKLYINDNFGQENLLIQRLIKDPMATLEKLNQDEKFKSKIRVSPICKWVINCLAKLKEDFPPFYLDAFESRCLNRLSGDLLILDDRDIPSVPDEEGPKPAGKAIDIPEEYTCPISMEIMTDPVTTPDDNVFERENIVNAIKIQEAKGLQPVDPLNNKPISIEELRSARRLRVRIEEWRKSVGL